MDFKNLEKKIKKAADDGLSRWVVTAHREAVDNLSGRGGRGKKRAPAGGSPVPVRTGNLRRLQGYVLPNHSKRGKTAGSGQWLLFNSAIYASVIHDGTHTSSNHGARPFAADAVASHRDNIKPMIITSLRAGFRLK